MAIAGIAIPLFVWFVFRVHGGLRDLLSVLFGVSVVAGYFYMLSRGDKLAIDAGGVEVRKVGVVHRFSWREIDRLAIYPTGKSVFLVARMVDPLVQEKYKQTGGWPRWDTSTRQLIICDLKVEAYRSAGKDGGTISFTTDRYSGGSEYVLESVKRYRPYGGFGGLLPPAPNTDPIPRRLIGVALAVVLAVLVTLMAVSVARSTDTGPTRSRHVGSQPVQTMPPAVCAAGRAEGCTECDPDGQDGEGVRGAVGLDSSGRG